MLSFWHTLYFVLYLYGEAKPPPISKIQNAMLLTAGQRPSHQVSYQTFLFFQLWVGVPMILFRSVFCQQFLSTDEPFTDAVFENWCAERGCKPEVGIPEATFLTEYTSSDEGLAALSADHATVSPHT